MTELWTEDLPAVVAPFDEAPAPRLVAEISVVGVGADPLHARVRLHGELCAGTTPVVAAEIERLLALGVADVRFDLAELRMCTSAGIDCWVDLAARVLPLGGDVRLSGASGVVRRALDAVGVSDFAQVQPRHEG